MNKTIVLLVVLLFSLTAKSQKQYAAYAVGFYNLENLFDTCHDEGKNDYEYLPNGSNRWDGLKYSNKLSHMARALSDMGTDKIKIGCAVIGVSEVENDCVLTDLVAQPKLAERGYKFVHIEGPDRRGVDCALLYLPSLVTIRSTKLIPYVNHFSDVYDFVTRGFFTVEATMAGEPVAFIVNHLPSRLGGKSSRLRIQGAEQIRAVKDSLLRVNPNTKIFVMGDMNDDPTDESMTVGLKGKANIKDVKEGDMYNPWYNILAKEGKGTLMYRGEWNLFDQILLTPNLLNSPDKSKDFSTLKFFTNKIQRMPYLFQTEGQYKGSPRRTFGSGAWLNGYSDHLPVVVYLIKEKK